MQLDDTGVVVSVNDRTERDLNRTFDPLDIDWAEIEEQLVEWGELCRAGKKLRVDLSFNYKDSIPDEATAFSSRGARGRTSATSLMLAEQARQIDAEEASTGHTAIWTLMYRLFRCPGPPCDHGPHCLIDPVTKKHRRLKAHHMRQIIEHVKQGGQRTTHDDVPQVIRDQLDAEERDRSQRHSKTSAPPGANHPPINITNVMPSLASQGVPKVAGESSVAGSSARPTRPGRLKISGPRDGILRMAGDASRRFDA